MDLQVLLTHERADTQASTTASPCYDCVDCGVHSCADRPIAEHDQCKDLRSFQFPAVLLMRDADTLGVMQQGY